jgi:putative ABC transport system substrate-binding protein
MANQGGVMNNRRKLVIALGAGALVAPFGSFAQPQGKVWRVGFLGVESASALSSRVEALRAGLRDFGYVEGKNILMEFRWTEGKYNRLPEVAAELTRLNVDVIVTYGTPGTRAAKQATTTIPIVMALSGDAVATGLVQSLARPGGNITGSTFFDPEISAKCLELIKETVPRIKQVGVLLNPANPVNGPTMHAMENAAKSLRLDLQRFEVRGPDEFEAAFKSMAAKRVGAVRVGDDSMFIANAGALGAIASMLRLPCIGFKELAEAGGMLGYGINRQELWRRAAFFVDKIFKGANPGDIPVERATKFELVVNQKTAKGLGIKIPNSILVRATNVIE